MLPVYIGDRVRERNIMDRNDRDSTWEGVIVGFESDTHALVLFDGESQPISVWANRLKVIRRGPNAPPGSVVLPPDFPF